MYEETVRMPRWLVVVMAMVAVGLAFGAVSTATDDGASSAVRFGLGGLLAGLSVAMLWVTWAFSALRIEIDEAILRFHFGPIGKTLTAGEIATVTVEAYRLGTYLGWGLRGSWRAGMRDQAYSVPFLRAGVGVTTQSGTHYHLSSRQPERLAEAANALVSAGGAAR